MKTELEGNNKIGQKKISRMLAQNTKKCKKFKNRIRGMNNIISRPHTHVIRIPEKCERQSSTKATFEMMPKNFTEQKQQIMVRRNAVNLRINKYKCIPRHIGKPIENQKKEIKIFIQPKGKLSSKEQLDK